MKTSNYMTIFCSLFLLLFPGRGVSQLEILRTMTTFDVFCWVDSVKADNFELDFIGCIQAGDIKDLYRGPGRWGIPTRIKEFETSRISNTEDGVEVTWSDTIHPLRYGDAARFGFEIDRDVPFDSVDIRACWLRTHKADKIPLPWAVWWINWENPSTVMTYTSLSYLYEQAVVVSMDYALLDEPIPSENLNWKALAGIDWMSAPDSSRILEAGGKGLELDIQTSPEIAAIFVRYIVTDPEAPEKVIARFINEAILEYVAIDDTNYVQVAGAWHNFEVFNRQHRSFDNLMLNIFGLSETDIFGHFEGPSSWGNPPGLCDFPGGFFKNPYDGYALPGGVQVLWTDRNNPIKQDDSKQFGLELNPNINSNLFFFGVLGYWMKTENITQIPMPWQRWEVDGRIVRGIISRSDSFPEPVIINCEIAQTRALIQLDSLNWETPNADWMVVQGDDSVGTAINPDGELILEIPIGEADFKYGTALVRYTVAFASNPQQVLARFTNAAEILYPPASGVRTQYSELPEYWLGQNYPNPFNSETRISFGIPKTGYLALTIYNTLGQRIRTVFEGYKEPGYYTLSWDGRDDSGSAVASGLYFYGIQTKDFLQKKKLVLMK